MHNCTTRTRRKDHRGPSILRRSTERLEDPLLRLRDGSETLHHLAEVASRVVPEALRQITHTYAQRACDTHRRGHGRRVKPQFDLTEVPRVELRHEVGHVLQAAVLRVPGGPEGGTELHGEGGRDPQASGAAAQEIGLREDKSAERGTRSR